MAKAYGLSLPLSEAIAQLDVGKLFENADKMGRKVLKENKIILETILNKTELHQYQAKLSKGERKSLSGNVVEKTEKNF